MKLWIVKSLCLGIIQLKNSNDNALTFGSQFDNIPILSKIPSFVLMELMTFNRSSKFYFTK